MPLWLREDRSRHLAYLCDRLREVVPWTDPAVVDLGGRPVARVRLSHRDFVHVTNARDAWTVEQVDELAANAAPSGSVTQQVHLAVPWDADVTPVAAAVLTICVRHWMTTANSTEVPPAVKTHALEQLDALGHGRGPTVG